MFDAIATIYTKIYDSVEQWNTPALSANSISSICEKVVDILRDVPGMTQAHSRDFHRATPLFTMRDGSVLKTWKNPAGVNHVFIADTNGNMVFGGFVGWIHSQGLLQTITEIRRTFT